MNKTIVEQLRGWEFDIEQLRESEGAFSSLDRRSPRAFSSNLPKKGSLSSNESTKPTYQWDHYSGLPGVGAYMER